MGNLLSTNTNARNFGKILLLSILSLLLLCSCPCWAIWDGGYFLTSLGFPDSPRWKPAVSDIAGKWQLSEGSTKRLQEWGTEMQVNEIEFHPDGTFKAINHPILLSLSDGQISMVFYTGTGTWEFEKLRAKPWSVIVYFDKYVEELPWDHTYYYLQGKESPFKMYTVSEIMVFEKK